MNNNGITLTPRAAEAFRFAARTGITLTGETETFRLSGVTETFALASDGSRFLVAR